MKADIAFPKEETKKKKKKKKACMKNNTHPYCLACSPSLHSTADSGRVRTGCAVWSGQTRSQLDKKRYHDKVTCRVVFPGQVTRDSEGEGVSGSGVEERGAGGFMVNVQCRDGPLLWGTGAEMSKKAERITSKDLSERDETSSDVIPFVSIFGRIFNLMVPDLNSFSFRR